MHFVQSFNLSKVVKCHARTAIQFPFIHLICTCQCFLSENTRETDHAVGMTVSIFVDYAYSEYRYQLWSLCRKTAAIIPYQAFQNYLFVHLFLLIHNVLLLTKHKEVILFWFIDLAHVCLHIQHKIFTFKWVVNITIRDFFLKSNRQCLQMHLFCCVF